MNKEEIQKEIDLISADRDALERTRNKLTGDIALLVQQIAEAKKPKLGHGDFGINKIPFIVIEQSTLYGTPKAFYSDQKGQINVNEHISSDLKLGNIFHLLKNDEFLELLATLKRKQS